MRTTITAGGLTYIGITTFVFLAAINSQTNLLFLAFGLMAGGFVAAGVLSTFSLKNVDVRRVISDHLIAGEQADLQYRLTNRNRAWPTFAIHITEVGHLSPEDPRPHAYCLHLAPNKALTLPANLIPAKRGLITLTAIRLKSSFPFGFFRRTETFELPETVVVYPRIAVLDRSLAMKCREATETGTMTSGVRRGNDEFYGLREYRAGDNVRSIHWRSTARTGQLTIREMASNAPPQMVVLLHVAGWQSCVNGEEQVERAIELAAALICYASFQNFAVSLAIPGIDMDHVAVPQMGRDTRASALYRLATFDPKLLDSNKPFPPASRLTARAEWITVTLSKQAVTADLSPAATQGTILSMDSSDATSWLHFVSGDETMRMLRESGHGKSPTVQTPEPDLRNKSAKA